MKNIMNILIVSVIIVLIIIYLLFNNTENYIGVEISQLYKSKIKENGLIIILSQNDCISCVKKTYEILKNKKNKLSNITIITNRNLENDSILYDYKNDKSYKIIKENPSSFFIDNKIENKTPIIININNYEILNILYPTNNTVIESINFLN